MKAQPWWCGQRVRSRGLLNHLRWRQEGFLKLPKRLWNLAFGILPPSLNPGGPCATALKIIQLSGRESQHDGQQDRGPFDEPTGPRHHKDACCGGHCQRMLACKHRRARGKRIVPGRPTCCLCHGSRQDTRGAPCLQANPLQGDPVQDLLLVVNARAVSRWGVTRLRRIRNSFASCRHN